jgi:hypothetical protein
MAIRFSGCHSRQVKMHSAQYKSIDKCAFITRSRLRRSQISPVLSRQNLKAWNLAFPVAFCLTASGVVRGEICTIPA